MTVWVFEKPRDVSFLISPTVALMGITFTLLVLVVCACVSSSHASSNLPLLQLYTHTLHIFVQLCPDWNHLHPAGPRRLCQPPLHPGSEGLWQVIVWSWWVNNPRFWLICISLQRIELCALGRPVALLLRHLPSSPQVLHKPQIQGSCVPHCEVDPWLEINMVSPVCPPLSNLCPAFVLPSSCIVVLPLYYHCITRPSTIVCALQRFSIGMCFRLYLHPGLWWDHNRRGWNIPLSKPTRISDSVLLLSNIVIPGLLEMVLLMFLKVLIFLKICFQHCLCGSADQDF